MRDIANAPTEVLINREHHRIATFGGGRITYDPLKTRVLQCPPRSWRRTTVDLIFSKTKRLRRLISEALK